DRQEAVGVPVRRGCQRAGGQLHGEGQAVRGGGRGRQRAARLQARQLGVRVRAALTMRRLVAALVVCSAATSGSVAPAAPAGGAAPPPKAETCAACHGPNGNSTQPLVPVLAGQTSRYLYLQLRDFQEGRRSDPQMSPMAAGLTRDEARDLSDWFAK